MSKPQPTGNVDVDVTLAHKHSSNHRSDLLRSEVCGCFYCMETFSVGAIDEWIDEVDGVATTAICPRCGIDSVFGSSSGFPIERTFLKRIARTMVRSMSSGSSSA